MKELSLLWLFQTRASQIHSKQQDGPDAFKILKVSDMEVARETRPPQDIPLVASEFARILRDASLARILPATK